MKKRHLLLLSLFVLVGHLHLSAQTVMAQYNNPPSTGTLDGIPFTFSGVTFDGSDFLNPIVIPPIANTNNFCALPDDLTGLDFAQSESWSITFDQPVTDLKLYLIYWRGQGNSGGPTEGTFSAPGVILSGSGIALEADGVSVTTTETWGNGIIEFPGPITTLSFNTDNSSPNGIGINFGLSDACTAPDEGPPTDEQPVEELPLMSWWKLTLLGMLVLLTTGIVFYRKQF